MADCMSLFLVLVVVMLDRTVLEIVLAMVMLDRTVPESHPIAIKRKKLDWGGTCQG